MDIVLEWPVTICEACGFNLRETTPKANEKSNDANGRLNWTDFCPRCGRGYAVGDRVLPVPPAEVLSEIEAKPVLAYERDKELEGKEGEKASGVPPDKRGEALAVETDPEGLLNQELKTEEKLEPGTIKPPGEGQYFCTKCTSNHNETSKLGKRHSKFKEV